MDFDVFECTRTRITEDGRLYRNNTIVLVATSSLHGSKRTSGLAIHLPICITVIITYGDRKTTVVGSDHV